VCFKLTFQGWRWSCSTHLYSTSGFLLWSPVITVWCWSKDRSEWPWPFLQNLTEQIHSSSYYYVRVCSGDTCLNWRTAGTEMEWLSWSLVVCAQLSLQAASGRWSFILEKMEGPVFCLFSTFAPGWEGSEHNLNFLDSLDHWHCEWPGRRRWCEGYRKNLALKNHKERIITDK
jgi:hypothetical protein